MTYTAWTQVGQEEPGTSNVDAFITNTWDPSTGLLTDTQVQNTAVSAKRICAKPRCAIQSPSRRSSSACLASRSFAHGP